MKCPNEMTVEKLCKNLAGFDVCDSHELPSDLIIVNILPRLPARSLVRFSATCKTWYSVIKSPKFITSHLKFNRSKDKDQYLLIIDKTCRVLESQTFVETAKFDFNLVPTNFDFFCHAQSCNGLFLLRMKGRSCIKLLLWNPSVRKSRESDTSIDNGVFYINHTPVYRRKLHGLGFNESCNDHRVVRVSYLLDRMTCLPTSDVPAEVDVYSVSTNSWRTIQADPGRGVCEGEGKGVYLNGAFHWFYKKMDESVPVSGHYSILLFDFVEECFREMALPADLCFAEVELEGFQEFQGSLAVLFHNISDLERGDEYCLWVMTEYGVAESWTKKFVIRRDWDYPNARLMEGFGFTKRGELIRMDREKDEDVTPPYNFFLNIADGKFRRRTEWKFHWVKVVDFMESLVLLGG